LAWPASTAPRPNLPAREIGTERPPLPELDTHWYTAEKKTRGGDIIATEPIFEMAADNEVRGRSARVGELAWYRRRRTLRRTE
jgi:hypothetical protein